MGKKKFSPPQVGTERAGHSKREPFGEPRGVELNGFGVHSPIFAPVKESFQDPRVRKGLNYALFNFQRNESGPFSRPITKTQLTLLFFMANEFGFVRSCPKDLGIWEILEGKKCAIWCQEKGFHNAFMKNPVV